MCRWRNLSIGWSATAVANVADYEFSISAEGLRPSYGNSIDLTIYRCIQESLTNAVRHAQARNVTVALRHDKAENNLVLTVGDDGCGILCGKVAGFGMRGMRERVEGLAGCYAMDGGNRRRHPRASDPAACRSRVRHDEIGRTGCGDGMTTVLVIDDHPIVLQGCRRMLEDAGVDVILKRVTPSPDTSCAGAIDPTSPSSILRCRTAGWTACR